MAGSPRKRARREAQEAARQGLVAPTAFVPESPSVEDVLSRPQKRIAYTEEIGERVATLIALRVPVSKICEQDWAPCETTLFRWRRQNEAFDDAIRLARTHRAESRTDKIDEISSKVERGMLDPIAARVIFDAEKWLAQRENPGRYGDNAMPQRVELTGANGAPLLLDGDPAQAREVARFYALILARGAAAEGEIELGADQYAELPAPGR